MKDNNLDNSSASQPKILINLILILLFVSYFINGLLIYQINSLKHQIDQLNLKAIPPPQSSPTILPTQPETAPIGWRIYKNSRWKYQINIPNDWSIIEKQNPPTNTSFMTPKREQILLKDQTLYNYDVFVQIYTSLSKLPNNDTEVLSFEEWINKKLPDYYCTNPSGLKTEYVNNQKSYHISGGCESSAQAWFFMNNGIVYEIGIDESTITDKEINKKIVLSFKFL